MPANVMQIVMFALYLIAALLIIAAVGKWIIVPLVGAL
jgi:hypothetical protein